MLSKNIHWMVPLMSLLQILIPFVFMIAFSKLYKRIKHWSCIILSISMLIYIISKGVQFLSYNSRLWGKTPDEVNRMVTSNIDLVIQMSFGLTIIFSLLLFIGGIGLILASDKTEE